MEYRLYMEELEKQQEKESLSKLDENIVLLKSFLEE
jgi:hypothetical protein